MPPLQWELELLRLTAGCAMAQACLQHRSCPRLVMPRWHRQAIEIRALPNPLDASRHTDQRLDPPIEKKNIVEKWSVSEKK